MNLFNVQEGNGVVLYESTLNMTYSIPSAGYGAAPMAHSRNVVSYFVKKPGEKEFLEVRKKKFSEVFADYFGDCPELKAKIKEEELTHKHIKEIINQYNNQCGLKISISSETKDQF